VRAEAMKPGAFMLSSDHSSQLAMLPETGMGYQIVTIRTKDGHKFERVAVIDSAFVAKVYGFDDVPFAAGDIELIELTHDKWDFSSTK